MHTGAPSCSSIPPTGSVRHIANWIFALYFFNRTLHSSKTNFQAMQKGKITKYQPAQQIDRQWPDSAIDRSPIWTSVDLRDGNQALAIPMNVQEKLEMFQMLVDIGFKEIEVGFPSASDTEFQFIRRLVEENRIPEDVTIQVLVQAREHLIRRTFESLEGVHTAIVHLYNSTSPLQRRITFGKKERVS